MLCNRQESPDKKKHRIPFGMDVFFLLKRHFDAGQNQKDAKDINQPMEYMDHHNAGDDKKTAHDLGADNPPEKNSVLIADGNLKIGENYHEDKEIVDTQRELDEITRQELKGCLGALKEKNTDIKQKREANPEKTPSQSLFHRNRMGFAVKDQLIHDEHGDDKKVESDP